jgi:hypothetical protein
MLPDYYEILGVTPRAKASDIEVAYLTKAAKCRRAPENSREVLTLLNDARSTLSRADERKKYDQARAVEIGHKAFLGANAQRIENCPAVWRDFINARYGEQRFCWTSLPRISSSISGVVFLVLGGVAGLIGAGLFAGLLHQYLNVQTSNGAFVLRGIVIPGVWVGASGALELHRLIRGLVINCFVPDVSPTAQSTDGASDRCLSELPAAHHKEPPL